MLCMYSCILCIYIYLLYTLYVFFVYFAFLVHFVILVYFAYFVIDTSFLSASLWSTPFCWEGKEALRWQQHLSCHRHWPLAPHRNPMHENFHISVVHQVVVVFWQEQRFLQIIGSGTGARSARPIMMPIRAPDPPNAKPQHTTHKTQKLKHKHWDTVIQTHPRGHKHWDTSLGTKQLPLRHTKLCITVF